MANLRADNLTGTGGRNAIKGSVFFSGYVDGTSADWLQIHDNLADFDMGAGDFTFECWVKAAASSGAYAGIFGMYNYDNAGLLIQLDNQGRVRLVNPGAIDQTGSTVFYGTGTTMGDWHHYAVTRSGTTLKAFVNGVEEISHTYSNGIDFSNGGSAVIGVTDRTDYPGDYDLKGYISNLRLVKGTALYTANFTPSTEKLTAVTNTQVLACQDSDDPTQEATGKTITGFGGLQESNDTELVTNSGFTNNISGWTTSGVQWTHSNSAMMHFGNGNTQRNAYQNVTTVVGKRYVARVMASSAEASTAYWQIAGATINYVADNNNSAQLEYKHYFTATSTSTQIRFYSYDSGNSSNVRSYWYNASIKLAPQGKAPKVLPPVGVDEGVVFDGDTKVNSQGYMYFPTGDTSQRGRGRGLHNTGYSGGEYNSIVYVNIQSMGNSIDFGDMTENVYSNVGGGNGIRGIFAGGYSGNNSPDTDLNIIDYVTIATTGNATTFGDTNYNIRYPAAVSNSTRMLICGGGAPRYSVIDYITIATTGDATSWGSLIGSDSGKRGSFCNSVMSPTRGIVNAGQDSTGTQVRNMTYMTIATLGSAADFGDLSTDCHGPSGGNCSSNTRGVIQLGMTSPNRVNTLEYVTIATTGDSKDFGDLTQQKNATSPCSNSTRGVFFGGGLTPNGPTTNTIDAVTIATTGNAYDFGDIVQVWGGGNNGTQLGSATSDSHGGLS